MWSQLRPIVVHFLPSGGHNRKPRLNLTEEFLSEAGHKQECCLMSTTFPKYEGPRARSVGHRAYDDLLKEIIHAVGSNSSREDLIKLLLDRLSGLSHANAIVILEVLHSSSLGPEVASPVNGCDQRGVNVNRWKRFLQNSSIDLPSDSLIHQVIEGGLDIDVWSVEHFKTEVQVFRPLFDVEKGGWLVGLHLPRATARHNPQGLFLWYQTGKDVSLVPPGSDQDWRFLCLFRECYVMAGYNIRKVARSIIMQRQEVLRTLTPAILNHEINARISFFKAGLEFAEECLMGQLATLERLGVPAADREDSEKALRKVSKQLLPQAARLRTISESVMGLTRRVASGPTDPVREVKAVLELLRHAAGDANVLIGMGTVPGEDIEIISDPALIMHIMVNLVLNAIDALKPIEPSLDHVKRVWIDVAWSKDDTSTFPLRIDVCDNGPGVKENFEARIFEPGITTKKQGHGLGLAIGNMISGYLGGELRLVSPRTPTIFRLSLPGQSPKMADLEEELKESEERP